MKSLKKRIEEYIYYKRLIKDIKNGEMVALHKIIYDDYTDDSARYGLLTSAIKRAMKEYRENEEVYNMLKEICWCGRIVIVPDGVDKAINFDLDEKEVINDI